MQDSQKIIITLPSFLSDTPVEVMYSAGTEKILCCVENKYQTETFEQTYPQYIFFRSQNEYIKIVPDDITYIQAAANYSVIHFVDSKKKTLPFAIGVLEKDLVCLKCFVRIHRSFIVNLRHIHSLIGDKLNVNQEFLPIGREYKDYLFKHFIF